MFFKVKRKLAEISFSNNLSQVEILRQLLNDGRSGIFGFQPQNTILTVCMIHRNSSFFGLSANHV